MGYEDISYLPIGSVVLLKEASKKIMITGFASVSPDTGDKVYDYSGCVFPEGFVDYDEVFVFESVDDLCSLETTVMLHSLLVKNLNVFTNKSNSLDSIASFCISDKATKVKTYKTKHVIKTTV